MKWGDVITLEYGRAVPDKSTEKANIPVYGTNGLIGFSNKEPLCKIPSVIIGRKGAYRGVHYSSVPFSVIDTAFYIIPKDQNINLKWVYYKFLTYDINGMDSGSAIPSTDRYEIYNIDVNIPPKSIQDRIVQILDPFEKKFLINKKINDNLAA